jgi:hypothetical protein
MGKIMGSTVDGPNQRRIPRAAPPSRSREAALGPPPPTSPDRKIGNVARLAVTAYNPVRRG